MNFAPPAQRHFPLQRKCCSQLEERYVGFGEGGWGVTCASRLCSWPKPTLSVLRVQLQPQPLPLPLPPPLQACLRYALVNISLRCQCESCPLLAATSDFSPASAHIPPCSCPAPALPRSCSCLCDISLTLPLACLISAIVHNFYCACCELVSVTPDELSPLPLPLPLSLLLAYCCIVAIFCNLKFLP